jgi:hypothetical protein
MTDKLSMVMSDKASLAVQQVGRKSKTPTAQWPDADSNGLEEKA